jgi:hypothetical protein
MSEPTLLRSERLPRPRRPGPTLRLVEQTLEVARFLEV